MAEIVNLKKARKAKARQEKAAVADANRALFGRTKAERKQMAAETAMSERKLDGALRTCVEDGDPSGSDP